MEIKNQTILGGNQRFIGGNQKVLPNEINLEKLAELLMFSDKYDISVQFWPEQIAVYIAKDDIDLADYGGGFDFAVDSAIKYLKRINGK